MSRSIMLKRALEIMFEGPEQGYVKPPRVASHRLLGLETLVGYKGKVGCFSVLPLSNGMLDIALFSSTPEDLSVADVQDAIYIELDGTTPGWGHEVKRIIKQTEL